MLTKVVPFTALAAQRRWKVEFFCADAAGSKVGVYPLVRLRTLLEERRETLDPQQHPDHVFNYLGLEHVLSITGALGHGYEPRPGRAVLSRSKVFRKNDLLYGRLRPALNKVFIADEVIPEGICSGEFLVLIPNTEKVQPHLCRALLASRYVQDFVKGMTTGSALPRLQLGDLLEIEVPLPPMDVQQRLETKLIEHRKNRRLLAAALLAGPAAELDALVNALEAGSEPAFDGPPTVSDADFSGIGLPDDAPTDVRGRGRPRGSKTDHGLFEPAQDVHVPPHRANPLD